MTERDLRARWGVAFELVESSEDVQGRTIDLLKSPRLQLPCVVRLLATNRRTLGLAENTISSGGKLLNDIRVTLNPGRERAEVCGFDGMYPPPKRREVGQIISGHSWLKQVVPKVS